MAKLTWDADGTRTFETGVDHGVLYVATDAGGYGRGVAWSGLTAVTESPSGAEPNKQYADNIVYVNLTSAEEFGGTIEAFSSPEEFDACDGLVSPAAGVSIGQQQRKTFCLVYRTKVGNDTVGQNYGYKLHLLYGLTATPSEKAYQTINESPEAMTLSWEVSSSPVSVPAMAPTSVITIDSTQVDAADLKTLETALFGRDVVGAEEEQFAKILMPAEVMAIFA